MLMWQPAQLTHCPTLPMWRTTLLVCWASLQVPWLTLLAPPLPLLTWRTTLLACWPTLPMLWLTLLAHPLKLLTWQTTLLAWRPGRLRVVSSMFEFRVWDGRSGPCMGR